MAVPFYFKVLGVESLGDPLQRLASCELAEMVVS